MFNSLIIEYTSEQLTDIVFDTNPAYQVIFESVQIVILNTP